MNSTRSRSIRCIRREGTGFNNGQNAGGTARPSSCRTSPPHGGRLAAWALRSRLQRWRLAKAAATSDLPSGGGDARQGRGGVKDRSGTVSRDDYRRRRSSVRIANGRNIGPNRAVAVGSLLPLLEGGANRPGHHRVDAIGSVGKQLLRRSGVGRQGRPCLLRRRGRLCHACRKQNGEGSPCEDWPVSDARFAHEIRTVPTVKGSALVNNSISHQDA